MFEFSNKKHRVLSNFARSHFKRLNGRIRTRDLCDNCLERFGAKYVEKFRRLLKQENERRLKAEGVDVISDYNNVITWRHSFAHEGIMPTYVTFGEVEKSYESGKAVVECLARAMTR